jgi:hypothetical protein
VEAVFWCVPSETYPVKFFIGTRKYLATKRWGLYQIWPICDECIALFITRVNVYNQQQIPVTQVQMCETNTWKCLSHSTRLESAVLSITAYVTDE